MRNSDNDKWDLPEFKQLGKNSKYLHGYLFDVSDNAGFYSYDCDELFVKTKLTEEEQKQSLEQLKDMKFIASGTMGMYLVLTVWQSATGGVPVLNESKLSEGSIKGIFKNGTHTNQWKQIEKKHKYFTPETIKSVFKLFFYVVKKESYSEGLATFLTLGSTQATTPNLNTNNTIDTTVIPKHSSNTSANSNSIIHDFDYLDEKPKEEKTFVEKNNLRIYNHRGKPCQYCNAKFDEACKKSHYECKSSEHITLRAKGKSKI
jgi:hypothetical protein